MARQARLPRPCRSHIKGASVAREFLIDPSTVDFDQVQIPGDKLDAFLPQAGDMRHLDRVIVMDLEKEYAVGHKDVTDDEFWCAGHFPGFPVFPGVLMLEALAQLCTVYWRNKFNPGGRAMLFGGLDKVKFRGAVFPGTTLTLLLRAEYLRLRLSRFAGQVVNDHKIVCEATITGVLGPPPQGEGGEGWKAIS